MVSFCPLNKLLKRTVAIKSNHCAQNLESLWLFFCDKDFTMYKAHLFICTNSPDRPGKCGNADSESLRKMVKEECKARYGKEVRVSSSGCLGKCEQGIAAVIYPQNKWLLELKPDESPKILSEIDLQLSIQRSLTHE